MLMRELVLLPVLLLLTTPSVTAVVLFQTNFKSEDGFTYNDDVFRGTNAPSYAAGKLIKDGGVAKDGALQVLLGGIDDVTITGMSGGWTRSFTLVQNATVTINVAFELRQAPGYESDEYSQALCSVDGKLLGASGFPDYLAQVVGDGNGGTDKVVGYTTVNLAAGQLKAGNHTIAVGGYNNKKTLNDEQTWIKFDSVEISYTVPVTPPVSPPIIAPTAPVPAPTAPIPAPTAPIPAPTAPIPAPTAPIPAPTAPIPAPTAPIPAPTAPIPAPTAPIPAPTAPIPAPTAPIPAPTAPIQAPTAPIQAPTAPIPAPTAPVQAPKAPIPAPTAPLPAPTAPITAPTAPIPAPTAPIPAPTAPIPAPTAPNPAPVSPPVVPPPNAPITPPTAPTATAIERINAGGGQFADAAGNTWIADNYFGGKGAGFGSCPAIVANTVDDELYCTNRWFASWDSPPFVYQIPVSVAGLYEVRLHFAELVSLSLLLKYRAAKFHSLNYFDFLTIGTSISLHLEAECLTCGSKGL
jgi:Malectin domain